MSKRERGVIGFEDPTILAEAGFHQEELTGDFFIGKDMQGIIDALRDMQKQGKELLDSGGKPVDIKNLISHIERTFGGFREGSVDPDLAARIFSDTTNTGGLREALIRAVGEIPKRNQVAAVEQQVRGIEKRLEGRRLSPDYFSDSTNQADLLKKVENLRGKNAVNDSGTLRLDADEITQQVNYIFFHLYEERMDDLLMHLTSSGNLRETVRRLVNEKRRQNEQEKPQVIERLKNMLGQINGKNFEVAPGEFPKEILDLYFKIEELYNQKFSIPYTTLSQVTSDELAKAMVIIQSVESKKTLGMTRRKVLSTETSDVFLLKDKQSGRIDLRFSNDTARVNYFTALQKISRS